MLLASHYLALSATLFVIGALGLVLRRNAIVVFMCIELMLNAVNISFVVFSREWGNLDGQVAVFFAMVVSAAEAAVGLAIIIALYRQRQSVESDQASELRC